MFDDEAINSIIDGLILEGGIEFAGIDSVTGEMLYSMTPKIKEIMPDLYEDHINLVNSDIMTLWEKGFIDIDFLNDQPLVYISDKSYQEDELSSLSKEQRWSLAEIKRVIGSQQF